MIARLILLLSLLPSLAGAVPLSFPETATLGFGTDPEVSSYEIAIGPSQGAEVPVTRATGTLTKQVWRISNPGITTFQMLDPLAAQLEESGFQTLFACESQACGGFDFRFGIDLIPAPEMFVDLGDYRYQAARKPGTDGDEYVALLVSRTAATGFVHLVHVGQEPPRIQTIPSTKTPDNTALTLPDGTLASRLETEGHVVLSDLSFQTGSSTLETGTFSSLAALADYLQGRAERQVALVGHTDAEGSLVGNIALSKRRASAVRDRLLDAYGVNPNQVEAEGVGYLAPIASNLTAEGRTANRRVEVILRSTD